MTSIAFTSLFLGLVLGTQPVGVAVEGPVSAVEMELDGKPVGRLQKRPWSLRVDFGSELEPHELVARALDAEGKEVARTQQWINLPSPPAEVQILLQRDEKGRAVAARMTWQSLIGAKPTAMAVTFDGKPLAVADPSRIELPPYDPDSTHLLSAELEFTPSVRSRADVVLGGRSAGEAASELTAVPVRLRKGESLPPVEALQDWFAKRGKPLRVVAVEKGPAQILIVRDLGAEEAVRKLGSGGRTVFVPGGRGSLPVHNPESLRFEMTLGKEDRMRFIWPVAKRFSGSSLPADLFDPSRNFAARDGGIHWLLTRVYHPERPSSARRFSDAVAVAGLEAVASHSRRAALLVLGREVPDASQFPSAVVRRYLEKLYVPLFVWSLEDPSSRPYLSFWGEVEDVSSVAKLKRAFKRLEEELESQQIVWIEGRHLPQEISLTERAGSVELAR